MIVKVFLQIVRVVPGVDPGGGATVLKIRKKVEFTDDARRLVVVSPNITVAPTSPGRPFQIRSVAAVNGDVAADAPVWYAKNATDCSVHVPVNVKLSARRNDPPVVAKPALVFDSVRLPAVFWSSLQKNPAGAATPLFDVGRGFNPPFENVHAPATGVAVGVAVGVFVGVLVGVAVTTGVAVGVAVTTGVAVGVAVGVFVGVAVGTTVGVAVGVFVGVAVGATVGVAVGVFVGVAVGAIVGVAVGVFVGVGVPPPDVVI